MSKIFTKTHITLWCLILAVFSQLGGVAQNPQDCPGAIPVCSNVITIPFPYPYAGMGNINNEIANVAGCYTTELNGLWYKFTVVNSGVLRFSITPNDVNVDLDWILFDMTGTSCAALANTAGASAAVERSNTWGVNGPNGPTGVSTPNGGTGICNGPGAGNGPKWCADLNVTAGTEYRLYLSNLSNDSTAITINFGASTALIYDNDDPSMDSIATSTDCESFDSLTFAFDEEILCSSVTAADFELVGPSGTHTVTSIDGATCTSNNPTSRTFTAHFTPAVTQSGSYRLRIKSGAGYVEDPCGNLDTSDSLVFFFAGPPEFVLNPTDPLCHNTCTGVIQAQITNGVAPYVYTWNSGATTNAPSGLCAGMYTVTISGYLDCEAVDSAELFYPTAVVASISNVAGVSCPEVTNCDGGGNADASGGTSPYTWLWSSGETTEQSFGLCTGPAWLIAEDALGCFDTAFVQIPIPDTIKTTAFNDTMICITNSAVVIASSTGGTPPYNYVWYENSLNGSLISSNFTTLVDPVVTTDYWVHSYDSNGCLGDTSLVTVTVRPPLGLEFPELDTICPYDVITVEAIGTGGDSLYSYAWSNGSFGSTITVGPDEPKWYSVTVSDLCGTPSFVDSVLVQVGGYPSIYADIRAEDDSLCPGESIYLIASGRGGHNGPDEYRFRWGHTPDSNSIQFRTPSQTETYYVTVSDKCLSPAGEDSITIYVDEMELPDVTFTPEKACESADVTIKIKTPLPGYRYGWSMGDGDYYPDVVDSILVYSYENVGCYDLDVDVISDFGCPGELHFPCGVQVLSQPTANFSHYPVNPTNAQPYVDFVNLSENEANFTWYIEHLEFKNDSAVRHRFYEHPDPYVVTLIVESEDGCLDTATSELIYGYETVLHYPKSFTPNDDGLNDFFQIEAEGVALTNFDLVIYDRWGEQVFRTVNPQGAWDGTTPTGVKVPMGAYPFVLRYQSLTKGDQVVYDHVIVIKSGDPTGLK